MSFPNPFPNPFNPFPNPFNPLVPLDPFNTKSYNKTQFIYVLCRKNDNTPIKAYENEKDIEIFDNLIFNIIRIPFIKSYRYDSCIDTHIDFTLKNNFSNPKL